MADVSGTRVVWQYVDLYVLARSEHRVENPNVFS